MFKLNILRNPLFVCIIFGHATDQCEQKEVLDKGEINKKKEENDHNYQEENACKEVTKSGNNNKVFFVKGRRRFKHANKEWRRVKMNTENKGKEVTDVGSDENKENDENDKEKVVEEKGSLEPKENLHQQVCTHVTGKQPNQCINIPIQQGSCEQIICPNANNQDDLVETHNHFSLLQQMDNENIQSKVLLPLHSEVQNANETFGRDSFVQITHEASGADIHTDMHTSHFKNLPDPIINSSSTSPYNSVTLPIQLFS